MTRFVHIDHEPHRLADQVYAQLVEAILSGSIGPGERLIQETLADQMTVSRTPVREALLRLEREGVIEPAPKRGFLVIEYTPQKMRDVFQARQAVEGFAARLVAENASDEEIEALRASLVSEKDSSNHGTAQRQNRNAHRSIVIASGNEALVELFDSLFERAAMLRHRADAWSTLATHTHEDLFAAIATRDGDTAEAAVVGHVQKMLDQLTDAARRSGHDTGPDET